MQERKVEYHHEGTLLEGFLAHDGKGGKKPAVLVAHAWAGRSPFEDEKARALARLGYVGFALDMYGKGVLGSSVEENSALMTPLLQDRARLQSRLHGALAAVRSQPEVDPDRIAAIGFCFGGLCVLDLARTGADVLGVASFHGLLTAPGNTGGKAITSKVLVLHGHDDPMVPVSQVNEFEAEMTAAGVDWQVHAYGGTLHSFTNPDANDPSFGTQFKATANRRSWATLVDFLDEIFA